MRQVGRYVAVGLASNLAGYLAYLLLTWISVGPKLAMSIVYAVGASVGYFGNRRWTFGHQGRITATALRYGVAHGCGYILNVVILYVYVDRMHYPHQLVQAVAIVVVAGVLFALFRNFVFVDAAPGGGIGGAGRK
jgi:putative flippase GtrA